MTEYIYIVKCPGCEDEMFNFFTDARMQCDLVMSKHPIITQVEVERNDFGECTDSHDLGTVWSWEEAMKDTTDAEPAVSVFTKDDLKRMADGQDPEFDNLDNSVDCEIDEISEKKPIEEDLISSYEYTHMTKEELYDRLVNKFEDVEIDVGDLGITDVPFYDGGRYSNSALVAMFEDDVFYVTMWHYSDDGEETESSSYDFETGSFEELWDELMSYKPEALVECSERKPIPDGMTIEQLVEEMEENEDEVECALCNDLFDKDTCRKELNLGWLCRRCADDLVARGEGPVFKSDNYWDFLDEGATYFAGRDEDTFDPNKYCEFTYTFDHDEYGELEAVFHESYADILEALKEIVDDDYVRELSDEDEPQTEAEWKAAGKWDEFFTVDITAHISNLTDELVEYFEEDREEAVKEAVKEAEEDYRYSDGPGGGAFTSWDDFWRWKEG